MAAVFNNFQEDTNAFINPGDLTKEISGFPQICISTFSENIINHFIETNEARIIAHLYSSNGAIPVYAVKYADMTFGLFLSRVGAPACVAGLEEIIALGAKGIVLFGCCGVLNQSVVQNKIIIPLSAVRDEGTSYHYIPSSEEISADSSSVNLTTRCLEQHGIPYVAGKVWTTDAIYRETTGLIEERKKQDCIAVDMECSASLAVSKFRNVPVIPFLFGADHLDSDRWEPRDLTDYGRHLSDKYIAIALEIALVLGETVKSAETKKPDLLSEI